MDTISQSQPPVAPAQVVSDGLEDFGTLPVVAAPAAAPAATTPPATTSAAPVAATGVKPAEEIPNTATATPAATTTPPATTPVATPSPDAPLTESQKEAWMQSLEDLGKQMLAGQPVVQPPATPAAAQPPAATPTVVPQTPVDAGIDFLKDLGPNVDVHDPTVLNKLLNAVYSRGIEQSLRGATQVVMSQVPHQVALQTAINQFYLDNPDLDRIRPLVGAVANEKVQANPNIDLRTLFAETEKEVRVRYKVPKQTKEVPNAAPAAPATTTARAPAAPVFTPGNSATIQGNWGGDSI